MFSLDGYKAALVNGGVVRRADRGVLAVAGADRAAWLQGLLTNDIGSLKEGESRYAAYLTPQGRMISDMNVIERGGRILLDVPAPLAASLRDRLDGLIFSEDVQVTNESATLWVWTVVSRNRFEDVIGETLPPELTALTPLEFDTFEVMRIERGVPRFLADMDEETIPLEAGIEDRAISFTKGCYVGQEVIVRVTTRGGGRVAKKLVRWVADASAEIVPLRDAKIFAFDREIGRVTSAAFSPTINRVVGLGYVHRDFTAAGTEITVVWNGARVKAVVE
jgi:folate-binding protein YgfZ